jgi:hypothetical protein
VGNVVLRVALRGGLPLVVRVSASLRGQRSSTCLNSTRQEVPRHQKGTRDRSAVLPCKQWRMTAVPCIQQACRNTVKP